VVYQPGGVADPSAGIYTDFASALAAAQALPVATSPTIGVDPTDGTPTIAASCDLTGIVLSTNWAALSTTLEIADGAAVTGLGVLDNAIILSTLATSAPSIVVSGTQFVQLRNDAELTSDGTASQSLIHVPSGATLVVQMCGSAGISASGPTPVIDVASGGHLTLTVESQAGFVDAGTLTGAGTIHVFTPTAAIVGAQSGATHLTIFVNGLTEPSRVGQLTDSTGGSVTSTLASIAAGTSYTQADMVAAKNAIASLAAKVNALEVALHSLGLTA
jgi:hypothetical protein